MPVKRFTRYGGFYFFSVVGGHVLNYGMDNFFISAYFDNFFVGLYSFGARMLTLASHFNPVMFLQGIVSTVLIRNFTKTGEKKQLLYAFKLYNKLTVFFTLPMVVGICILADKIILHFFDKSEYLQSLPVIWTWSGITLFTALTLVLAPLIRVIERSEIMIVFIVFAVVNIGLDILLIPRMGIYGALVATGSSRILTFLFQLALLKRYLPVRYPWPSFLRIGMNITAMGILVFFLRSIVGNLWTLIGVSLLGAVFYFILSYLNKGFDQKDRRILNEAIGRKLFVF
jgi:O-antigen/teichoic acid export membrane protein